MDTIFEYGEQFAVDDRKGLESYLCSLWKEYKEIWPTQLENENTNLDSKYQPFLSFDGKIARARNYIGFIHFENSNIEIYPKIFQKEPGISKELMHRHLFYWFSYCKKVKFPFNQALLDRFEIDELPELIIYLFANQIHEVVSAQPYSTYEEVQEALFTPRGRINFDRYATRMSYGSYHLIDCDYEPFVFDNSLNRIIKYCTRLLLSKTRIIETQRVLNEIIFMLDEVDDQFCSVQQLQTLRIPSIYSDYEEVIQICRMILENQVYSYAEYEMKNWSLLFPIELVFEDFIAGYIQKHFSDIFKVETQKSDLYLHINPNTFNLQHDILLTNKKTGEQIIVDTKYKPRWNLEKCDSKKGIAQTDMYQMISYAYRRGTDKVLLIYPNTSEKLAENHVFLINKGTKDETIKIKAVDVPFWSLDGHLSVEKNLKVKLRSILSDEF
ncbi:McrC family protein [Methanosarcina sp.]|uniref:McrC family protein n=1 Tax=Methanosarcina sp. TaxID=2213 RepID=UPI002AB8D11F|nr:McrC family protein [Methanosarcina sp.]MDY9925721.1 McrC family protein [Methanosarcina sp.]